MTQSRYIQNVPSNYQFQSGISRMQTIRYSPQQLDRLAAIDGARDPTARAKLKIDVETTAAAYLAIHDSFDAAPTPKECQVVLQHLFRVHD